MLFSGKPFHCCRGGEICLSKELEKLRGEPSNVETSAIAKYSSSHEYLHDLGIQYVHGFEYFQA